MTEEATHVNRDIKGETSLEVIFEETEDYEEQLEKRLSVKFSNVHKKDKTSHFSQFQSDVEKISFVPLDCIENFSGNYENYLKVTLSHLASLKNINFEYALEDPALYYNYPNSALDNLKASGKKILLLDLDETLIHTDFDEEYLNNKDFKYDTTITFSNKIEEKEESEIDNFLEPTINPNFRKSREESQEETFSVGIFLRNGVKEFLSIASKYFEIGIFTASTPEYANAAIDFLDPSNTLIKFRLYRNHCINVNNLFKVKDLRLIKGIDLKNIVLVDNNMYSFAAQINNGILINSFWNDKKDNELMNVLAYLLKYIFPSNDVREVNEQVFGFRKIMEEINMSTN